LTTRSRLVAVACILCGALACSGDSAPASDEEAEEVAAPEDPAPAFEGDPLLTRARAELHGGRLPDAVRAEIVASTDPAHARAKGILAVMDRQARGEPEPEPESTDDDTPGDAPSLKPPPEGTPPVPEKEEAGASSGGTKPPAAGEGGGGQDSKKVEARLAVLTRLTLKKSGKKATLTVHAASSVRVGVATQASGKVRLVVESAGALPAVLQARPSVDGLTISDVRRGQDTVQIAVDLGEGWKPGRPSSFSGGARMTFTR
jgi:hypothetical protein